MSEFKKYSVGVYILEGSELEKRIQALADQDGVTFEETLKFLANLSMTSHLERNVTLVERSLRIKT